MIDFKEIGSDTSFLFYKDVNLKNLVSFKALSYKVSLIINSFSNDSSENKKN